MDIINILKRDNIFYRVDAGGAGGGAKSKTTTSSSSSASNKAIVNETRQNNTNRNNSTTTSTSRSNTSSSSSSSSRSNTSSSSSSRNTTSSKSNGSSTSSANRKLEFNETRQLKFNISGIDYLKKSTAKNIQNDLSSSGARREQVKVSEYNVNERQEQKRRDEERINGLSSKSISKEKISSKNDNSKINNIMSFTDYVTEHTSTVYKNGTLYYLVDDSTANTLSVGPSIVLKYSENYFKKYGIDVNNLKKGDTISKDIVDKVTKDILSDKRKSVLNVLEKNGINNLTNSQIDALVSRSYSVGNINGFVEAYKKYGNTEELYNNYLSSMNGKGTIYEDNLTKRREAEMELFKNGYKSFNDNPNTIDNDISGKSASEDYNSARKEQLDINKKTAEENIKNRLQEEIDNKYYDDSKPKTVGVSEDYNSARREQLDINKKTAEENIKNRLQEEIDNKYYDDSKPKTVGVSEDYNSARREQLDINKKTAEENIKNKIAKEIKEDSTTDAILKEKHKNTTESRKENEAGNTNLINFLTFEEGHTPLSADGKYYLISDSLDGVATAGSGVTLKNCASYFAKYGIDVNNYKAGDYIPVDIVDKVKSDLVADKRNYVINLAQENNITLTDNQIDALTSRAYQFGNIEKFPAAYKEAGGDIDTFVQNYMMSGGYSNRRERESNLFKNGYNI